MQNKNKILISVFSIALVAALILLSGCTIPGQNNPPVNGNDQNAPPDVNALFAECDSLCYALKVPAEFSQKYPDMNFHKKYTELTLDQNTGKYTCNCKFRFCMAPDINGSVMTLYCNDEYARFPFN